MIKKDNRQNKEIKEEKKPREIRTSRNSSFSRESRPSRPTRGSRTVGKKPADGQRDRMGAKPIKQKPKEPHAEGAMRLNKYIAHAGICSRREADELIAAGSVKVNGKVVTEMGYQVLPGDEVQYGGEKLRSEKLRYFLLNKPKGFITTTDDPQERRTVMMLMDGCCAERIYPVGRLDRATTGLLPRYAGVQDISGGAQQARHQRGHEKTPRRHRAGGRPHACG